LAGSALGFLVYHFYYREAGEEGSQVVVWVLSEIYRICVSAYVAGGYGGRWTAERRVYNAADVIISNSSGMALAGALLLGWHWWSLTVPMALILLVILEMWLTPDNLAAEDYVVMAGGAITGVALMAVELVSLGLGYFMQVGRGLGV